MRSNECARYTYPVGHATRADTRRDKLSISRLAQMRLGNPHTLFRPVVPTCKPDSLWLESFRSAGTDTSLTHGGSEWRVPLTICAFFSAPLTIFCEGPLMSRTEIRITRENDSKSSWAVWLGVALALGGILLTLAVHFKWI